MCASKGEGEEGVCVGRDGGRRVCHGKSRLKKEFVNGKKGEEEEVRIRSGCKVMVREAQLGS